MGYNAPEARPLAAHSHGLRALCIRRASTLPEAPLCPARSPPHARLTAAGLLAMARTGPRTGTTTAPINMGSRHGGSPSGIMQSHPAATSRVRSGSTSRASRRDCVV